MNKHIPSDTLLEHAWRYFELHANQRISIFNFFLFLSGVVAAGLASALQGSPRFSYLGVLLGLLLVLVSFVFWKLDQRASFLIKHAEQALAELERDLPVECSRLFHLEPGSTKAAVKSGPWWLRLWTYGKSFRLVFAIMGAVGIGGAALSVLKATGIVSW